MANSANLRIGPGRASGSRTARTEATGGEDGGRPLGRKVLAKQLRQSHPKEYRGDLIGGSQKRNSKSIGRGVGHGQPSRPPRSLRRSGWICRGNLGGQLVGNAFHRTPRVNSDSPLRVGTAWPAVSSSRPLQTAGKRQRVKFACRAVYHVGVGADGRRPCVRGRKDPCAGRRPVGPRRGRARRGVSIQRPGKTPRTRDAVEVEDATTRPEAEPEHQFRALDAREQGIRAPRRAGSQGVSGAGRLPACCGRLPRPIPVVA